MASQTFNIAAGGDDGFVRRFSGGTNEYPPVTNAATGETGTSVAVQRSTPITQSFVDNGLLRWDTSPLPNDANVTGATLRVYCMGKASANSLSLTAEWYNWGPSVDVNDYTNTPGTSALTGVLLASIATNTDQDFVLVNANANVSLTGYTYLRLHISQRPADAQPTGSNSLEFASYENPDFLEARLIVTYDTGLSYVVDGVYI